MVSGGGWVVPDRGDPVPMRPGDVAVIRSADPYTFADDPSTAPHVIVHPGQRCATPQGAALHEEMALGVRTWGSDVNGEVTMLLGVYENVGEVGRRLLDALPPVLVVSPETWDSTLVSIQGCEIAKDALGQEVRLDRLLDLLLISVLWVWFDRPEASRRPGTGPSVILSWDRRCGCCTRTRRTRGRGPGRRPSSGPHRHPRRRRPPGRLRRRLRPQYRLHSRARRQPA